MYLFLSLFVIAVVGLWLLFRDTMNKIQYIQSLRIYWITRDNGVLGTQVLSRAFMRQTAPPWWVGSGVQLRIHTWTFQVGVLHHRSSDLLNQLDGRYMSETPQEIRSWK